MDGCVLCEPICRCAILPSPALPCRPAVHCCDATAHCISGFWIQQVNSIFRASDGTFPDMPCMKRVYRDKIGVGTLVSSQEPRALFVSLINRLQTGCQPLVNRLFCSSVGFKYEFRLFVLPKRRSRECSLDSLEGKSEGCLLAGSTQRRPVLSSPALPRCPAVRRPDPTRPWCVRVLDSTGFSTDKSNPSILVCIIFFSRTCLA